MSSPEFVHSADADPAQPETRKRPAPGERRLQILQALAAMLEESGAARVTTAALAARLEVSEAALYRHFASKAQMFEGLIDFIESAVFGLIRQVSERPESGRVQAGQMVTLVLQFAEKNPGMARVMGGDALVLEHERLQQRMNLLLDKLEVALRQALREDMESSVTPEADAKAYAALLADFVAGRLQRFARSDFRRRPTDELQACLAALR